MAISTLPFATVLSSEEKSLNKSPIMVFSMLLYILPTLCFSMFFYVLFHIFTFSSYSHGLSYMYDMRWQYALCPSPLCFLLKKEPKQVSNHGVFDAAVYFASAMLGNNVKI